MSDFYEIDFLPVGDKTSGDAIPLRYCVNGQVYIHVVDGGFQDTGQSVVDHVNKYYDRPTRIDHVVVSHPDGDHAGGLRTVLETFKVGALWMLRPWLYADELLPRFVRFTSVENLKKRLKDIYPNIAALEEIADERDVDISEPFQGEQIGAFTSMAPTKARYLDLIVESERSPEAAAGREEAAAANQNWLQRATAKVISFAKALWGHEVFSDEETSAENEMSVVQYANLCGSRILLTADAGRAGLQEAADYAPNVGLLLPGLDRFQIPHHGSRHNVSTELLDRWLGARLPTQPAKGEETFSAIVSAAKDDKDHPRKSVVRAAIHRGARVVTTQGSNLQTHKNAPDRGWRTAEPLPYPDEQEE